MTYYLKQKPKLVESLIRKKICKIVKKNKVSTITITSLYKKIYTNFKWFYFNYLKDYMYIIITILIISYFLYYRYHYQLNKKKKENKIMDIIPNNISYNSILQQNIPNINNTPNIINIPTNNKLNLLNNPINNNLKQQNIIGTSINNNLKQQNTPNIMGTSINNNLKQQNTSNIMGTPINNTLNQHNIYDMDKFHVGYINY